MREPDIQALLRGADARRAPGPNLPRLTGHRPELPMKSCDFRVESFNWGVLDHEPREMMRDGTGGMAAASPLHEGPP